MNNTIPVFYHVPKCGGTYIFNIMRGWCDRQEKAENIDIKTITITRGNTILYRLFSTVSDLDRFTEQPNTKKDIFCNLEDYNKFKNPLLDELFFIIIEPESDWVNFAYDLSIDIDAIQHFITLREPFKKIKSLYNYLNSNESNHEPSHKKINKDFKSFIESYQYEDCFTIRRFQKVPINEPIKQCDYDNTLKYFEKINIKIANMTNIDETFNDVLSLCNMSIINSKNIKNDYFKTNIKKIKNETEYFDNRNLGDFPQETINYFNERAKYDIMLYKNYFGYE